MPGEQANDSISSLDRVLEIGTDGLKVHPMHVVKGTQLGRQWKRGDYHPLTQGDYVTTVVEMLNRLPKDVVVHRLTGTASREMLLAPLWCEKKWAVLNEINEAVNKAA
jgi:radical SAM superfamily enzyme